MKVWPFGAAFREEASNRHMLRWLTTVVVSDVEKAPVKASGGGQEDDCCGRVVIESGGIETGASFWFRDESGGCPAVGQMVSGVEAT
jgi:hypothetical protein